MMMMNPIKWLNWKIQEQIDIRVNPPNIRRDIKDIERRLGSAESVIERLRCPHPRDNRKIRSMGEEVVICTKCNAVLASWEEEDKPTTTPQAPIQ